MSVENPSGNRKSHSLDEITAKKPADIVELIDFRDPLEECTEDSTRNNVRRTINQLPASYARILELRYGDDLTVPEIARLLQLSESAAESRLVRARQAFRESWGGADAMNRKSALTPLRSPGIRYERSHQQRPIARRFCGARPA